VIAYVDASALVKRYVDEPGSDEVESCLAEATPATSRLSQIEIASAVARRCRDGDLSQPDRDHILADLRQDLDAFYIVEVVEEVVSRAESLLLRHPLRAGDALQLASGLTLQERMARPVLLHAFDHRLTEAAKLEGLAVHPQ